MAQADLPFEETQVPSTPGNVSNIPKLGSLLSAFGLCTPLSYFSAHPVSTGLSGTIRQALSYEGFPWWGPHGDALSSIKLPGPQRLPGKDVIGLGT